MKRERLLLAIGRAQIVDEFERWRLAQIIVEAERLEIIGIDARHQPELHAPAEHLVDDCDFLGQAQRMIERHDVAHRTDAHAAGARAGADRVQAWRRHPAFVRAEVMLDAEAVIETEFVAQLKFAPQLLVALVRGHPRLAPDMGKMGELHWAITDPIPFIARDRAAP